MKKKILYQCPCCLNYSLESNEEYEICPCCSWENDFIQLNELYYSGGANPLSLVESRLIYLNRLLKIYLIDDALINEKYFKNILITSILEYKELDPKQLSNMYDTKAKYETRDIKELLVIFDNLHIN